jgi:hypothetical protein
MQIDNASRLATLSFRNDAMPRDLGMAPPSADRGGSLGDGAMDKLRALPQSAKALLAEILVELLMSGSGKSGPSGNARPSLGGADLAPVADRPAIPVEGSWVVDFRAEVDPKPFVGMPVSDAFAKAKEQGDPARITFEDGVRQSVTADVRPERVNFIVNNGIVTDAGAG